MPTSHWCSTRTITVLSLLALSVLSLTVIFRSGPAVDTQPQHSLFSYPKRNTPLHRRAFHHARSPSPATPSVSNAPNTQVTPPTTPTDTPQQDPAPSQPSPSPSPPASSQDPTPLAAPTSQSPSSSPSASSPSPSSPSPKASDSPSTVPAASSNSVAPSPSSPSSGVVAPSSQGVTNLPARTTINSGNYPATTFQNTPASNTPDSEGTVRPISSSIIYASATGTGAPSGFLAHKGAVGVTFTLVGLVSVLGIWIVVLKVQRRRRRARARQARREFYEKKSADVRRPSMIIPESPASPGFGDAAEGPFGASSTNVSMMATAMPHAYPDRAVHYGQPLPGSVLRPTDYGIAYPPVDNFTPAPAHGDASALHDAPSAGNPFADPASASHMPAAPPVSYRRPTASRAQEVLVDSYYGVDTAGVGAADVGYAQ
ncbi:hypothetical protein BC827DRAFT_391970 [Russula dissimulans]|nr:hypothetical protein BC827DRAFT_391970 [Russula dissimulans]